jgi:hypothetical protein
MSFRTAGDDGLADDWLADVMFGRGKVQLQIILTPAQ